jgi:hypothetical protein
MTKAPAVARPDGGDRRRRYRRLGKSSPAPRWPASGIATFPPVTGVAADAMYFCGLGPIAEVKRCQYARHGAGLLTPEAETETRFTAADTSSGGRSSRTATCGPRRSARCIRPLTAACRGGLRGAQGPRLTASDLHELKMAMAAAHLDAGGTSEAFVAARRRYEAAKAARRSGFLRPKSPRCPGF